MWWRVEVVSSCKVHLIRRIADNAHHLETIHILAFSTNLLINIRQIVSCTVNR